MFAPQGFAASRWMAMFQGAKTFCVTGIGLTCLLAVFMLWQRGPSQADIERARLLAEQNAIRGVFEQDKTLGQEIGQKIGFLDKYWDGSVLVGELAGKMNRLDLSGCPQDFQLAYKRHATAWAALANVKASNEGFQGFLKGFLTAGLSVVPAIKDMDLAMQEIRSSWLEVQQVAIRHGVAP